MKKILKILVVSVLAIACAASVIACVPEQGNVGSKGLKCKKIVGVYTVYDYVSEDGVTELDLGAVIKAEATDIRIKKGAFSGNDTLVKIIVPERVTEIDAGAFEGMKALESLELPFVGKTANSDMFYGESKKAVDKAVDSARTIAHLFGTEKYDAGAPVTIGYNANNSTTCYMPLTLKEITIKTTKAYSIPMYAFNGAVNLYNINLVGNIDGIGESAFANCKELREITLPETVTVIYENAFNDCVKLATLNLSANASMTVKAGAFVNTKLNRNVLDTAVSGMNDQLRNEIFGEIE